jgi:branched-chain amino acid transport system substrate-binding protein
LIRDDGSQPDTAKRIAQEMIVNDRISVLAGFTFTPVALAVAPLATEAKIPEVVMAAGTSIITERSPYITRTFFTIAQVTMPMAQWAGKNVKKVVTLVSDYAPGHDAEKMFSEEFKKGGGEIVANLRVPCRARTSRRICSARATPTRTASSCSFRAAWPALSRGSMPSAG